MGVLTSEVPVVVGASMLTGLPSMRLERDSESSPERGRDSGADLIGLRGGTRVAEGWCGG